MAEEEDQRRTISDTDTIRYWVSQQIESTKGRKFSSGHTVLRNNTAVWESQKNVAAWNKSQSGAEATQKTFTSEKEFKFAFTPVILQKK
jgi:hypothetical protein